jgi:hypothetical protein
MMVRQSPWTALQSSAPPTTTKLFSSHCHQRIYDFAFLDFGVGQRNGKINNGGKHKLRGRTETWRKKGV